MSEKERKEATQAYLDKKWEYLRQSHLQEASYRTTKKYAIAFTGDGNFPLVSRVMAQSLGEIQKYLPEFEKMFSKNGPVFIVCSEWKAVE